MKTIYIIGRESDCDICLWDETNEVSRHHAQLRIDSKGKYWLMDTSTNGTYVNGLKITPGVEVIVNRNDDISFAHIETLDWTQIPKKTNKTLIVIIIASIIIVAGIACGLIWGLPKIMTSDKSGESFPVENMLPTDSIQSSQSDSTSLSQKEDTIAAPVAKNEKPVAQTSPKSQPKEQANKSSKENDNKKEDDAPAEEENAIVDAIY